MMRKVLRFLLCEDGPTAVEYCFILALILMACLMGIAIFGSQTYQSFSESAESINDAFNAGS